MYAEINYKDRRIGCEWGYVAEKNIGSLVLGIDNKANICEGSIMPNLMHYSFDMKDKEKVCHLNLAVTYIPKQISELVGVERIAPQENLDQEVYSASLSAHSKDSRYLDTVINWLKEALKWIDMKQDILKMDVPLELVLNAHKELIDKEDLTSN